VLQVRTPFGGVVTGLIIILTCVVLSPYLAFIPTSVLSAVIIFSMFSTIAYKLPYKLWKSQSKPVLLYLIPELLVPAPVAESLVSEP
jgi:solute carrier family 26 (sodium-independent sulfate anion transporter), member 11